jgi:hypothetical protein
MILSFPTPALADAFKANSKLRKAAVTPETTYTSTGYVMVTYYLDGTTCGSPSATEGYAVDTCYVESGASYKYQLTGSK